MRKRVVLVCGSLQRHSANRAALEVVAEAIAPLVDQARFEELSAIPAFAPDLEPLGAVVAWRALITSCDGLIIAAPEYAGGLAGAVKNALDWLPTSGELYGRPIAILSAGTSGGVFARQQLLQTLTWQGAHVVASVGLAGPASKRNEVGALSDSTSISALRALARTFVHALTCDDAERLALARTTAAAAGVDADRVSPVTQPLHPRTP